MYPALVDQYDSYGNVIPGEWRRDAVQEPEKGTEEMPTKFITPKASAIRKEIEKYFMSKQGQVPWQFKQI